MLTLSIIAQVVRAISAIFLIIADRSSNRKTMLVFNAIYNLLNGVQYLLLGAITGAISSFITVLRNVIFYRYKKRAPLAVLLVFFIIVIAINLGSVDSWIAMLPILFVVIYSTALYIGNVFWIKIAVIVVCGLEIIYDYVVGAYVGMSVCDIDIVFVSISFKNLKKPARKPISKPASKPRPRRRG